MLLLTLLLLNLRRSETNGLTQLQRTESSSVSLRRQPGQIRRRLIDWPRLNFSCCARVHEAVVAALDAGMIFVAGNQQDSMHVAVGKKSLARNLSEIIDVKLAYDLNLGCGNDQIVHVDHGFAIVGKKSRPASDPANPRFSYHLAYGIDAEGCAAGLPRNNSEIGHHAVLPAKCMVRHGTGYVGPADNKARVADPIRLRFITSQGAQVG